MEFSYSLISVSASAPKIPYRSDTTNDTKTVLYFFTEFTFLNFYEIFVYSKFQKKGEKRKIKNRQLLIVWMLDSSFTLVLHLSYTAIQFDWANGNKALRSAIGFSAQAFCTRRLVFLYKADTCKQRIMSPTCPGSIWCQRESSVLTLKNDLSQQDLEGGRCVWQSPAPCWQPNRVEEEGIIRITHTNIQIHTSTHKFSCTEPSHTLRQTCEIVCMPACAEKKRK